MPFKRLLITIDASEIGVHATDVGLELASALAAQIAFIHVIAPAISDGGWFAIASPELEAGPGDEISRVLSRLSGQASTPAETVRFTPVGEPASAICEAARNWRADLVIIGSHGRAGVDRAVMGSVAEAVARNAPCPVLIVRR